MVTALHYVALHVWSLWPSPHNAGEFSDVAFLNFDLFFDLFFQIISYFSLVLIWFFFEKFLIF